MIEVERDRDLRIGLLALQLGLVDRETLTEAIRDGSSEGMAALCRTLAGRGGIGPDQMDLLRRLASDLDGEDSREYDVSRIGTLAEPPRQGTGAEPPSDDPYATRMITGAEISQTELRFRRLRTHAEGGLGVVYVAHDRELNRDVALKEIKERSADDTLSRDRFRLEAEVTGGLEHPGVVPVYSMGTYPDGRPYYAMRFVRGITLQEAIERHYGPDRAGRPAGERSLEFRRFLRTFLDVCNTIGYAHSRGVIHRDIKPSNIMIGKFGETLVVDWGLAKAMDRPEVSSTGGDLPPPPLSWSDRTGTIAGSSVGSPGYMSPEQASGRLDLVGTTSDIFSLGATLYTILTGRPAYEGRDLFEILGKMGRGEFPRPRQVDDSISRSLEAVCLKAMATVPAERYANARALADDIEHWLGDEAVTAMPDTWLGRVNRWGRKHRAVVRAVGAALVLLTTLSTFATVVVDGSRKTERIERLRAEALSSGLSLDRALARLDRGEAARAMLRLTQSLAVAPAGANDLRLAIRTNIGGWGRHLFPLKQTFTHSGRVRTLSFSPDGRRVLSGSPSAGGAVDGGEVLLWDVENGRPVGPPLEHRGTALAFSFGPKGTHVLTGSGTSARLWDQASAHPIGEPYPHPDEVRSAAFRADGQRFAIGGATGQVQVWDVRNARAVGPPMVHPNAVLDMAFSPDGSRLVTGCADGSARVWDTETGAPVGAPLPLGDAVHAVAYRPDGGRIAAAGGRGLVKFWEAKSLRPIDIHLAHPADVLALAYNGDGTRIVTGSEDNRARVWDAEAGRLLGLPIDHRGSVEAVAFAADGQSILSGGGDGRARVWDLSIVGRPDPPIATLPERVAAAVYLDNARSVLIAGTGGTILRRDVDPAGPPDFSWNAGAPIQTLAVRPDRGEAIVLTEAGDALRLDLTAGGTLRPAWEPGLRIRSVAYRPDGKAVLTGGDDGVARLRDLQTGAILSPTFDHRRPITVVAVHPGRPIALTVGGGVAQLWDLATGVPRCTLPIVKSSIYAADFSPDGRLVATGGEGNMVRIWEVETGQPMGLPLEHRGSIGAIAFSPDSRSIVSGSNDGVAILWDVATSKPLGPPFLHDGRVTSVGFSPSGGSVLTTSHDHTVRRRDLPVPVPDDLEFIDLWVRATTGMALDAEFRSYGVAQILEDDDWRRDRRALDARGGPPRLTAP